MPYLELLGGFALQDDAGNRILLPRKARALLAILALERGRPIARERAAALLWESRSDESARASLRQALTTIRRAIDTGAWLVTDGETLAIDPAAIEVDVVRFQELADHPDGLGAACELFRGDLLEGLSLPEAGFSAWLTAERARCRDTGLRLLESVGRAALDDRRTDVALALGSRLIGLDPLHEPGVRLVMRAHVQGGRPGEALRVYRKLQAALRDELGVAPEPETIRLRDELASRRRAMPATGEPAEAPGAAVEAAASPSDRKVAAPTLATGIIARPRRERRQLAALSVGLADYAALSLQLDVERLYALIEAWHGAVTEEVARAGGTVHDRMADTALAVFGRDHARDDDPVRAASAAFAIHRRATAVGRELGLALKARAGIAVGMTLVSDGPYEAAIVGGAVTLAATLRAAASPGETLGTAELVAGCGTQLVAVPQPGGRFRLDPGQPAADRPPMVGRRFELAQLQSLLAAARSATGVSVCLRGEAGIGKSRLAEALAEHASGEGWQVHRAQLADFGRLMSHTPRRQLIRSLLGGPDAASLVDHPAIAALAPEHLPWIHQLIGLEPPAQLRAILEETPPQKASEARVEAARALVDLTAAAAPLLILVEDIHWSTPQGLLQLADLSRLAARLPLMLLMTTRADSDPLDPNWRASAGPLITIDLQPLSPQDSKAMAQLAGSLSDEAMRICVERANGNPLFLAQLVAAVRDGAAAATALPASVQSLALGRMDRLDPEERLALRAASVLGPVAELSQVSALTGVEGYAPSPAALGPLVLVSGNQLRFVHALIRDAIHSSLLEADRRALHRAAAELSRTSAPEMVAVHLENAEDPSAAAAYAEAAEAALQRFRSDKALEAAARGLAIAATSEDRHRLLLARSAALAREWQLADAVEAARDAEAISSGGLPCGQAILAEAVALAQGQNAKAALEALDRAEAALAAAGDEACTRTAEIMARLFALRGHIHFPRGELDACLQAHRKSLHWAGLAGTPKAEAGARVGMAWAHYQRGDFAAAVDEASRCVDAAATPDFDRIRLAALRVRAVCRIFLLEHEDGLADAESAIALAMSHGDAMNELLARTTAGTIHLERWEQDAAIEMVEPALALRDRLGNTGLAAAPLWVLGTAFGSRGDNRQAIEALEAARELGLKSAAIRFAVPRICGTLAFFVDRDRRASLVEEGEALLERSPVAHSAFGFYGSLVHAALAKGEWTLAERCAEGLRRYAGPSPVPWAAALLDLASCFGRIGRGEADADCRAAAERLHARARTSRELSWLRPSMRAVEQSAIAAREPPRPM